MSVKIMCQVWEFGPKDHGDLLVLLALADFADDNGKCWPSMAAIAEKARMTDRGVRKVIRRLETAGYVETAINRGRGSCNVYTVKPEHGSRNSVPRNTVPRNERALKPERACTKTGTTVPPEPSGTIKEPSYTPLTPQEDFEAFWSIAPRKVGKGAARKAYERALRKVDAAILFSAMEAHAESRRGKDPQYTPHPATWLNQERWLDEAPAKPRNVLDEIERMANHEIGLSDARRNSDANAGALPSPIPSARAPGRERGERADADDGRGYQQSYLRLVRPRRFGGAA